MCELKVLRSRGETNQKHNFNLKKIKSDEAWGQKVQLGGNFDWERIQEELLNDQKFKLGLKAKVVGRG